METPADRLKQARIDAGFKTAKAAILRFGWVEQTYYAHEADRRNFHDEAAEYARAFKVTVDWLLTGKGEKPDPTFQAFLSDYRSLDPVDQKAIAEMIRAMADARRQGREQTG